jgi:hypothetical protein
MVDVGVIDNAIIILELGVGLVVLLVLLRIL